MVLIRCILAVCLLTVPALAQTATLRGQVTDESGALVPGARVSLAGPGGVSKTTTAASDGSYAFTDLAPGEYVIQASAPSLALRQPLPLSLKPGRWNVNGSSFQPDDLHADSQPDESQQRRPDHPQYRVALIRPGESACRIGERNLLRECEQSSAGVADAIDVLKGLSRCTEM